MTEFEALDSWLLKSRKNDAWLADKLKVSRSKFSRFRNGLQFLPIEDLLKLEDLTGITPAECAEFYAKAVKERTPKAEQEAGGKPAKRPFGASPAGEPVA